MIRRRVAAVAIIFLGLFAGSAFAAFVSTTSTGVNTFTTRAVASRPVISGTRITTDPTCAAGTPADTVRQGGNFYICVNSITDSAGIASASADLSSIDGGDTSTPLTTTGGPYSGYQYRSAAVQADSPLDTGTSGAWSVQATNTNGDRTTTSGLTYNIRSYTGMMLGEFGAAATSTVTQYYHLSDTGTTAANIGSGGAATGTYYGTPIRRVGGAIVGSTDGAVQLNGTTDYISVPRRATIGADYTLEIWVKGTATSGSGPGTLWSDSAGLVDAGTTANANDFGVAVDASGRIVAGCGNAAASTIRSAAGVLSDANWHHVVFTRTRTTGAIALYIDGASVATSTACNTTNQTGSTTVYFGRSHESGLYLAASLDEPALYARVLPLSEIQDHYLLGTGTG